MKEGAQSDVVWFERTGHCGGCGQPGDFCRCTKTSPCLCSHLHPMGSGFAPGAIDAFVMVDADQERLF